MTRRKRATVVEPDPHFRREEIESPSPGPASYISDIDGRPLKWRPNVDYCLNGTGWAYGKYLEALNPESRYRSICIPCRIWRRQPAHGLVELRKAHWRAYYNEDGRSRRPPEDAEERMKRANELAPSPVCATCGELWTVVDARFEAPSKGKSEKEWRKRYETWLELPGARQQRAQLQTS